MSNCTTHTPAPETVQPDTNTVRELDRRLLARARDLSQGVCADADDPADYVELVKFGRSRGILQEELPEWPLVYSSPRWFRPKDSTHAQALRASGLACFRRTKSEYDRAKAWKEAQDAGQELPERETETEKKLPGMRPRLGGCLVGPTLDLDGEVVSWWGRYAHGTKSLAEVAGDYDADEADVVLDAAKAKYLYLPAKRSSVQKYPMIGILETIKAEEHFPLLLSPRLIEERKAGFKNAATVPIWITEGVLDGVLAFLGGAASVATNGAYVYQQQVKFLVEILREFAGHHYQIYLAFDADPARWDPYKRLQLGPGQRGSCMLLASIWALDSRLARAIRVVELPSRPDGSKLDLGDLLTGAAATVPEPQKTGDLELADLEREERKGYVQAVKAARAKLLAKLAATAKKSKDYLIGQIPAVVEVEDRTSTLRETGLLAVATHDPDCWDSIADDVAQKLQITKAHDIRSWKAAIGKKAKEQAKEVKREEMSSSDVERFRREDGSLKPTYDAARVLLERDFSGRLAWDEMALDVTLDGVSLGELAEGNLLSHLSRKHGWDGTLDVARHAIGIAARSMRTTHPVREYLESVRGQWKPGDLDTIPEILKAMGKSASVLDTGPAAGMKEDPEGYLDSVMLRKWLRAAVARIFDPGCKADNMLILQGEQEARKSSFFEALVPARRFFTDSYIDIKSKDGQLMMRKFWLIEIQEVDNTSWYDSISEWKAYITTRVDSLRPPYGAKILEYPRMSILCGTTNEDEFLVDKTGCRRFWVVQIPLARGKMIDVAKIRKLRDLIWAQAIHAYDEWVSRGQREEDCCWWLTPEEKELHTKVTARFQMPDPLLEQMEHKLIHQPKRALTAAQVADLLGIDAVGRPGKIKQIGHALRELKWTKGERVASGYVWHAHKEFPKYDPTLQLVVDDLSSAAPRNTPASPDGSVG